MEFPQLEISESLLVFHPFFLSTEMETGELKIPISKGDIFPGLVFQHVVILYVIVSIFKLSLHEIDIFKSTLQSYFRFFEI